MMQKIQSTIIAVILCLAFVLIIVPAGAVPDTGVSNCTRSYLIELVLGPSGVNERAVQVVYGYSPLPEGNAGTLSGVISGTGGKNLSEFRLHDPRIQFGDEMKVSEDGRNRTALTGISRTEKYATLVIMFPVTADARAFGLYDSSGKLMKSVDLTKATDRATWNCTPDYGIPVRKYDYGVQSGILIWIIGGLVVLVVAAGAGWYLLKKKDGGKQT